MYIGLTAEYLIFQSDKSFSEIALKTTPAISGWGFGVKDSIKLAGQ